MRFQFMEDALLPCLSWCASMVEGSDLVAVRHGASVYCADDFFAEGAWSGPMTGGGASLRAATVCSASGATVLADGAVFVTHTDTMARLHAVRVGARLAISNSLAFVLAECGLRVDREYLFYEQDLSSIVQGIPEKRRSIPTSDGNRVDLFWHCNVFVRSDLTMEVEQKALPAAFACFAEYHSFLIESLRTLCDNANDARRRLTYRPIVSISKGYDSPTCAVLARSIGCTDAVTIYDPSAEDPFADSGMEIANVLNMEMKAISRDEYKGGGAESEFLSVGTGGEDVFMAPLDGALRSRILLTGFHGDKVWDLHNTKVTRRIVRGDPSGADLEEFRLRVDFIHAAVPFFGCMRHPEIHAISVSPEMAPWSVGGDYDRPICRRIVESAGIERASFGQRKRVMSRAFFSESRSSWYFGPRSLTEFSAYAADRVSSHPKVVFGLLHTVRRAAGGVSNFLSRASHRLSQIPLTVTSGLERYEAPLDERRFLFHWAIERQIARYARSDAR